MITFFTLSWLIPFLFFGSKVTPQNNKVWLDWKGKTALENLQVYSADTIFNILIKKSQKQKYTLSFNANEGITLVQVKGEFNNWNPANSHL